MALPFLFEDTLGFRRQVETGLLMTPWPLAIAVVAPIAGRLADRYPVGILGGCGLAADRRRACCRSPCCRRIPRSLDIVWRMTLCGVGFGFFQSPNNRAIIGSAPRERSGGASGMLGTARLLGQTMGAALVALVFGVFGERATGVALFTAAGFAILAAGVSCLRLIERQR